MKVKIHPKLARLVRKQTQSVKWTGDFSVWIHSRFVNNVLAEAFIKCGMLDKKPIRKGKMEDLNEDSLLRMLFPRKRK
jgi:hypothetical protein